MAFRACFIFILLLLSPLHTDCRHVIYHEGISQSSKGGTFSKIYRMDLTKRTKLLGFDDPPSEAAAPTSNDPPEIGDPGIPNCCYRCLNLPSDIPCSCDNC